MKKFEGILIATDLDDTLLDTKGQVSEENRAAIEYFKSEGGFFTFATARALFNTKRISDVVPPNAPIVFLNGGGIYDFVNDKLIWAYEIDRTACQMADFVCERVDGVSVVYAGANSAHSLSASSRVVAYAEKRRIPLIKEGLDEITVPICKVIFVADSDEMIELVADTLKEHPEYDRFEYRRIEAGVYQIFPKGLNKGDAFEKMVELFGVDKEKTITVGDHRIDVPMFERARLGIAVSNGIPFAKEAADIVTVSNDDHALARIISDLDWGIIKL